MTTSGYRDTFARDNLPPQELWPDLINLEQLGYPERLNCAVELLDRAVEDGFGDKVCIYSPSGNWTYRDLLSEANRLAHVLTDDLGLVTGERVLLHGCNSGFLAAYWFGILKAGGIVVATMPLLRARELGVICEKARCRIALCDAKVSEEALKIGGNSTPGGTDTPAGDSPYAFTSSPSLRILLYGNGELEKLLWPKPTDFKAVDTAADDVALISFTSGTTGVPKGTMHFHRDVLTICDCFPPHVLKPREDDIFIGSPPLAFTFGLGGLLLFPMRVHASTVLLEKAPPPELTKACETFKATVLFTSPTGYRFMLDNLADYDLSSLRRCVSAGETLPKPTSDAWFEKTGLRIIDGIGATEMLHIFISAADEDIRPGATGKPVWGYEAKVIDDEGNTLGPGEIGRLAVRGPTGCRYLADDRQTNYVVKGWNVTGDAYQMDEDGYFWFQARNDDMIISCGYNISGPEVEEALLMHPAVKQCAVVAAPDGMRGNIVKAYVVLRDPSSGSSELVTEMQDFVKQTIAPYKYPRAIEFMDALPTTENGKLQRFKLRELACSSVES